MWLCFNDAFVSVVQDRNDPGRLIVRARRRDHLETLFPDAEILTSDNSDYLYRVFVDKQALAALVQSRVMKIGYDNFKNSVTDKTLHTLYQDFWRLHRQFQESFEDRRRRFTWELGDLVIDSSDNWGSKK